MSVIDVIGVVTGHTPTVCSHTLQNLIQNFPAVVGILPNFKFTGRGQRDTYVADAHGITEIVILPGGATATVREQAAPVLVRYLGGDMSIVNEIAQNKLTQQELDEEHPARLGATVEHAESDRVKRTWVESWLSWSWTVH